MFVLMSCVSSYVARWSLYLSVLFLFVAGLFYFERRKFYYADSVSDFLSGAICSVELVAI